MNSHQPDSTTVFLVSGGARGVTAACVVELARRFRCSFILLGRSALISEPDWAAGAEPEAELKRRYIQALLAQGKKPAPAQVGGAVREVLASREVHGTLAAVAEAGGRGRYICVDVADPEALRAALGPEQATITGILHGAGAIADKLIENKTESDFEKVYAPKVEGLVNLLACVPAKRLQYLLLFSSVAGFYGNIGQADYALANEILDKAAHELHRQQPSCRVMVINWGPWDGGMVSPELKSILVQRGVPLIPLDQGARFLACELGADTAPSATQVIAGPTLPSPLAEPSPDLRQHRIRRRLTLDANPFLRDHVIGGHAVLPTVCAVAWISNAAEQLYPGYMFYCVEEYRAFKGIVFDETLADEYVLDLRETSKQPAQLVFEGAIWSVSPDGKPRYHYRANVTLVRERPPAPDLPFDRSVTHFIPGAVLYSDNTLFHGPSFRGVDSVLNLGPTSLTARCHLPEISREVQGQFPVQNFNPYFADVQLQSLLVWAKNVYGYGGLPLRIVRGEKYHPAAFGETTYATLTVRSQQAHNLVADVTVHNEQGELYSRVTGAEITLSPRLNDLFKQNRLQP
jgi:NAD(P)-dependent dehydrogenase (short-subunit alcohol dehydrogenase family)